MSNDEINISDLLPPNKDVAEKFATSDTVVPGFIKEAAYSPMETQEQSIQKDWERLVEGLSDYVLAEQLTERELVGMGKPLAENYAEYFRETLTEVKKSRKKSEQKLFKMIPRHSQLDTKEFFDTVREQNEKESEARERTIELYPRAGVVKLEVADVARKGLKKEAAPTLRVGAWVAGPVPPTLKGKIVSIEADRVAVEYTNGQKAIWPADSFIARTVEADWTSPEAQPGSMTNPEPSVCASCKNPVEALKGFLMGDQVYCMPCHDAGHSSPAKPVAPPLPNPETLPPTSTSTATKEACEGLTKEANAKWKAGQNLEAKHNGAEACVAYVNEDDKTYVIRVCGTMYPSYYSFEDAHETFTAKSVEEGPDSVERKSRGV